jgi:hypothetical protein
MFIETAIVGLIQRTSSRAFAAYDYRSWDQRVRRARAFPAASIGELLAANPRHVSVECVTAAIFCSRQDAVGGHFIGVAVSDIVVDDHCVGKAGFNVWAPIFWVGCLRS